MELKTKRKKETKKEKETVAYKIKKELKLVFKEAGLEYDQEKIVKIFFSSLIKGGSIKKANNIMRNIRKGIFKVCPRQSILKRFKGCECSSCNSPPYFYKKDCEICGE